MAEPFLGQICPFGFNFPPRGWAQCGGQIMSIAQNTALFSLLGTMYGGNGQTTFGLPDLRGRVAISDGQGSGLSSYAVGEQGGAEIISLSQQQLPSHSHTLQAGRGADSAFPPGMLLANAPNNIYGPPPPAGTMDGGAIGVTGGGQPHENRQPYLVINWCIALEGIFPPRN